MSPELRVYRMPPQLSELAASSEPKKGIRSTLKQQPGKDLVLFGGVGMAQTFVQRGLIDDYRLVVHPVLLGSGKPLFQGIKNRIPLKLGKTKTFRSGAILLSYQSLEE